jgi:membrane protein YdbS with pleckstrin-like domain
VNRNYLIAAVIILAIVSVFFPHFVPWVIGVWPVPAGTSPWYQFWSGFFIVILSLVTSTWLRKQNCHVRWCWRLGRFPVADGQFCVCRHHSPDVRVRHNKVTFEHIQRVHDEYTGNTS